MRTATEKSYYQVIAQVVQHILTHLDEPIELELLAKEAGYSPFHFHRVFSAMLGEGPSEFVRRLRLERAAHQLVSTKRSIGEIALDAGYATHEAFLRAFTLGFTFRPAQFRKVKPARIWLPCACDVHYSPYADPITIRFQHSGGERMDIQIKTLPTMRVAGFRHIGPYNQIGTAFKRLGGWFGQRGLTAKGAIGVWLDDPAKVPHAELRSDALFIVDSDFDVFAEELIVYDIPEDTYATVTYRGSYSGLEDAWNKFVGDAIPSSGREFEPGYCFEWYVDDCQEVPEEQLRTELYMPVKA